MQYAHLPPDRLPEKAPNRPPDTVNAPPAKKAPDDWRDEGPERQPPRPVIPNVIPIKH
jgi:hypothetical protein